MTDGTGKRRRPQYSAELRGRAVRMVREALPDHPSRWSAVRSVAEKIGCTAQTLQGWVGKAEQADAQQMAEERARLRALEREVRELRQANEILRKASAYFAAAELDRRSKT
ncbi:Transposase [Jannaschia aquimarina]|uniref:Transposase n=1 Tax=Jannaschia aquimarina TaxID=935700 RepID=A0A0D1DDM8_9RHOB|nr:Transposase [Jannaschia aquimarina]SNT40802.1 Transposase [Jannaschia aquimarina]